MQSIPRTATALVAALVFMLGAAAPSAAQEAPPHQQAISANPFGLLLEFFNAEYERVLAPTSTAGIGGSFFTTSDDTYLNADLFWRYYPGARALDGWAFGVKAGITHVPDQGVHPGFGFDLNHSWLLGPTDSFYVGLGFGLKRLIGVSDEDFGLRFVPTIRIVNVGWAF